MVHFWGPLDANTEPLYANHVERPVIVILASIKISEYKGSHVNYTIIIIILLIFKFIDL